MRRLDEIKSLVNMARALGTEPEPYLLEELNRLETQLKRIAERVQQHTQTDLAELFNTPLQEETVNHGSTETSPDPSTDSSEISEDTIPETAEEIIASMPVLDNEETQASEIIDHTPSLIDQVVKNIAESTVVNPEPTLYPRSTDAIDAKIRKLENWVSKIAATGAGSGEVWFRWLNDVNYLTMQPENDNWVANYNADTKKVEFTTNVGPVQSYALDTSGTTAARPAGTLSWNQVEDCLDINQHDGTTLQVGLEQYMQVHNPSSSQSISNGTVVRFGGVEAGDLHPLAEKHIADGSIPPLYTIGVITEDIAPNADGRATTFGKVRNLNTTGSEVGENWVAGDILWLSPTTSGTLTKFKPTAPNIVVSVAAVLSAHSSTGVLLVRPTIWPRLYYGRFSNTTSITTTDTNTGVSVTYNTTVLANGFHLGSGSTSRIWAENSGFYDFAVDIQAISTNAASKNLWIWAKKNNEDLSLARRHTIAGNNEYKVITTNFAISMDEGDYVEIRYAVDDTAIYMIAEPANDFAPAHPSVLLTVTQLAL
jgi:hypothetical protein